MHVSFQLNPDRWQLFLEYFLGLLRPLRRKTYICLAAFSRYSVPFLDVLRDFNNLGGAFKHPLDA